MQTFIQKYQIEDLSLCDDLIEYHKSNIEYKVDGAITSANNFIDKDIKDSIDVKFFNISQNKIIQSYFNVLSSFVKDYVSTYNIHSAINTDLINNIQYYPPGGGYKTWHYERDRLSNLGEPIATRALVYMTYLNDVTDKGETEWYYQKIKIKPKKGLTVIWPTDFTHTHRGIVSPTQEKYIVTGWFHFI
jgi:hypothetical protein